MKDSSIYLRNSIKELKLKCKEVEIKGEFENEGSMFEDIAFLNGFCKESNVPLNIKIGGSEALRDIYELSYLGIDGIICPMVESAFSVKKFKESIKKVKKIKNFKKRAILVETITGLENLKKIIQECDDNINTLIIGRNDLSASLEIEKAITVDVNNMEFLQSILNKIKQAKKIKNLKIGIGGKLSIKTLKIIKGWEEFIEAVDFLETRKVVLPTKEIMKNNDLISMAIKFEKNYLLYKKEFLETKIKNENKRLLLLESRLNTEE